MNTLTTGFDPNINEMKYIFTREAYALYQTISPKNKLAFWAYNLHGFRSFGDNFIWFYQVEQWFDTMNIHPTITLNTDCSNIIKQYNEDHKSISMQEIFNRSTHVHAYGKDISVLYDLEFAEYVLNTIDADNDFEIQWWNYEVMVERNIYRMILGVN